MYGVWRILPMRRAATSPPTGPATDLEHWSGRDIAELAAECDAIRERRGLPDMILRCLLDDIAVAGVRADNSSCSARYRNSLPVCGSCAWCALAPQRAARLAAYQRAQRTERAR
jgi:hypothetical protein